MKKVAVLKETINGENRVILLPKDIEDLVKKYEVYIANKVRRSSKKNHLKGPAKRTQYASGKICDG